MPRVSLRRWCSAITLLAILQGCSDQGPGGTPDAARLVGDTNIFGLAVGGVLDLRLECLDRRGRVLRGTPAAWVVNNPLQFEERPGRVALDFTSGRARIRGVSEGPVFLAGGCLEAPELRYQASSGHFYGSPLIRHVRVGVLGSSDTAWILDGADDTLHLRAPSVEDSLSGVTQLLTARDAIGTPRALNPAEFNWNSDDTTVARVGADGFVRAQGPGITTLRIQRRSRTLTRPVRVESVAPSPAYDITLVDAHWTQGAQDEAQRIPIVRNGRAAAVNVLAHATNNAAASAVTLQVWNAEGQSVWTHRVPLTPTVDGAPSLAAPSAQILVPRPVVRVAASWRVTLDRVSDADPAFADANAGNDSWPRTGTLPLVAVTAPTLRLRLVPLRLAGNGDYVVPLTPEMGVFYDSTARIRLPLGEVVISIEPPLRVQTRMATAAELAIDPNADAELWSEALDAVDSRRLASGAKRSDYWVGVLPKPSAESSTRWGGMAYLPASARDDGPMSRSMLVRGHDWYASPVSASGTLSHELGHSFGLRHAPCGTAGGPDPAYPVVGGGVGSWVHWVSAWEHGTATRAELIAPTVGDFMGYCPSNYVGPYHYRAMLAWRATADEVFATAAVSTRVLAVRGSLSERGITVRRPAVMDAEPVDAPGSDVTVEVLAADGRVLARGRARTGQLSDGTAIPFVAQLPISPSIEAAMARVRVTRGAMRAESVLR